jgi:hypothetical protein
MEYYSAMKKNDILTFAAKWVELDNIRQAQKDKYHVFSV